MGYYEEQKKINIFLKEKFKALITGDIKKLDIHKLVLELTTQHAMSKKYIMTRITDLLIEYPIVIEKNGDKKIDVSYKQDKYDPENGLVPFRVYDYHYNVPQTKSIKKWFESNNYHYDW